MLQKQEAVRTISMAIKTFKFKIYRSNSKKRKLNRFRLVAAEIYNHAIALHKRYYRRYKKHLDEGHLKAHLAKLRRQRPKYNHWNRLNSTSVQDIVERIEKSYQAFFAYLKAKKSGKPTPKRNPPKFKKWAKYKSFTMKHSGWKLIKPGIIRIGTTDYRYHNSRPVEGIISTVTVLRDACGDYYVLFTSNLAEVLEPRIATGKMAGMDFGLKTFLTLSDATTITSPQFFRQGQKELAVAQRKVSSKEVARQKTAGKKSHSHDKAQQHLARKHRRIQHQRQDFQHKTSLQLAITYDQIFVEDLDIVALKRQWGRKVSDYGFTEFLQILDQHCHDQQSLLVNVDRWFPSSKRCSVVSCGYIYKELSLKERSWVCPQCHTVHNRDFNAATNLYQEGTRILPDFLQKQEALQLRRELVRARFKQAGRPAKQLVPDGASSGAGASVRLPQGSSSC